jgi:hypothetical protein
MSQDLMINLAEKGESYEKQFKPKMFSGYFQNINELQNFLYFSRHFQGSIATISLGLAYGVWKDLKGDIYAKINS